MVDTSPSKGPYGRGAVSARRMLSKVLQNSMRRADIAKRPHSWHFTKFEDCHSDKEEMRISSVPPSSTWHPAHHASSSTTNLSETDCTRPAYTCQTDHYSSCASMDSFDQLPMFSVKEDEIPTGSRSSSLPYHHQHAKTNMSRDKQDSAYSSFSVSDRSDSAENVVSGGTTFLDAIAAMPVPVSETNPPNLSCGEGHGHCTFRPVDERQVHCSCEPSASHYENVCCSFKGHLNSQESLRSNDCIGGTGKVELQGGKSVSSDSQNRFDSLARDACHKSGRRSIDYCHLGGSEMCERKSEDYNTWAWTKPSLSSAVSVDCLTSSCALLKPPPPPVRSVSFVATRNHDRSPSWSGPEDTIALPQLPLRGTSSCNLVTHAAQPAFELLNPIPWNARRNSAMQPPHCSFSRSSSQSHHRSASVQGWQCLAPSSFSHHSCSPSLIHSSGSRQDSSFGSSEHVVRVSDSQFKSDQEGVWEHKAPEKATSMLELSSHCGKCGELSHTCSHLPHTGPQLPGESVDQKHCQNYLSENENGEGLLLTAKKRCTISSSSNSGFKGSFDKSDFSRQSEKSKFVHTPWKESHPQGKTEENPCGFKIKPVHTKQPANHALEPDCHDDDGASGHTLNMPSKLINAENTPMLHQLTQNGVFFPENDIHGGGEGRGIRRSDRFATTLRNEIQLKRAQLQRSRSSGQLLPEEDEEEKDRTVESNVHGDMNDSWKLHLSDVLNSEAAFGEAYKENVKEAQTKVLRATSFCRKDLEIRLPVSNHSQLIESRAALALPFDRGCSVPPLHVPRIGGRKRLAEAQKKLSYSEPEKIDQVGLFSVTNILPNLNEKEDIGCTVRDTATLTNSSEEDGCITAVERRSVADRCRFFEKETNKVGQRHQSLSHNQQQHSFLPITQSTDTILQKGPLQENYTFEIGAVSQKPVPENQHGIGSNHSNLSSAMMAESPLGVSEPSKKVLDIPGGWHDCNVKNDEGIVKNVHHSSDTNKNLQNTQMIEPNLEQRKSAWLFGRRHSMDDVLEQGNCCQHVHSKSTPSPGIQNENQSRFTSARATTCQEGELSAEWDLSRCLDPQQLQRDPAEHEMDQKIALEFASKQAETQEDNCVGGQEAVLEKHFGVQTDIVNVREKPQAVLSRCKTSTDAGQLETVNQEKVLGPISSLPQYSPWLSLETTSYHENPCKISSGDESVIRVSNDPLIKDFTNEDGVNLSNSTNESFCNLPSPRIGAPLIQTPAPPSFTLESTATTRSEAHMEAPQRVKTVPLTIIASNGRVNQMYPTETAFPGDLMFTTIQEDEPEEAFDECDTNSEVEVTINGSQLDVISSKNKDTEDQKNQELMNEIEEHHRSLADVLVPATEVFTTCELIERMFSHENLNLDEELWHRRDVSGATTDTLCQKVEEELMVSSSSLPACPAYYLVSAAKAELLMKLKEMQPSGPGEEEEMYPDLTEKKAELIHSIGRKLQTLREARQSLLQDVHENEQLGANVEVNVCAVCKPNELDKYRMFVGDLDKVVNLLLSLSGRLARVDNALCSLGEDTRLDDRHLLEEKRRVLSAQYQDACELKENLERRRHLVDSILAGLLSPDHLQDYQHFIKLKSALVEEQRELDEKIKLGEEQLRCLRESMPPEYCLTETYNN